MSTLSSKGFPKKAFKFEANFLLQTRSNFHHSHSSSLSSWFPKQFSLFIGLDSLWCYPQYLMHHSLIRKVFFFSSPFRYFLGVFLKIPTVSLTSAREPKYSKIVICLGSTGVKHSTAMQEGPRSNPNQGILLVFLWLVFFGLYNSLLVHNNNCGLIYTVRIRLMRPFTQAVVLLQFKLCGQIWNAREEIFYPGWDSKPRNL